MDENQDGCIDQIEPVECEVCKEPVKGNETNTLLDSEDMGAIAVVGGWYNPWVGFGLCGNEGIEPFQI